LTAIGRLASAQPRTVINGVITNKYHRKVSIVNIDPANDHIPYPCAVNIADLITLDDVMDEFGLGPNGGMMYCMEYLEKNLDWLIEKLKPLKGKAQVYSTRKFTEGIHQHFMLLQMTTFYSTFLGKSSCLLIIIQ
jgi:Conserved hypothetical ATP binding protein